VLRSARRSRLLALLLVEVALLAAAAVLVSLPLTLAALHGIRSLLPAFAVPFFDFDVDATVVGLTCGLAGLSTLVFGLIPALKAMRAESSLALQSQGTRQTGGKGAARFRVSLTTAQIALSMALLVVAGWFAQSLANIARVDLGFRADSLSVFSIAPERNGYAPVQSAALFDRLEEDLAQIPGVASVSAAVVSLLAGNNWGTQVEVEGYDAAPGEALNSFYNYVSPSFFRTLGMPLVTGTGFEPAASGERKVAIVNERFAARFGLGADALGKHVSTMGGPIDVEIVGVVRDAKYSEVKQEIPPQLFMPRDDAEWIGAINFYVRSDLATANLRTAVGQVLARHDPNLPLMEFRTLTEQVKENVFLDRFMSTLATALAGIATVLAAIGIYGVLSYGVVQRFREIGLRMALGAAPQSVRGMVLKQVMWMAGIGLVIGLALALLLGEIARALLFGLAPTDPLVPAAAALILAVLVLAAAYWPARRAALVDPVTALRGD
jgi:predicted permease